MRSARIKLAGEAYYHCMSRVIERRFALGRSEQEQFRRLLRACEEFCGVRVLTYALMSNHFHLLVEVPVQGAIGVPELLRRVGRLYSQAVVADLAARLEKAHPAERERLQARYTYRMGDVSEFIKTLKQRFTQWYNRRNGRRGTLWEERFKSVVVEGRGKAILAMAAYIDLNPVRAGLVEDPKDYRFSGYGEAVAGGGLARAGLARVLEGEGGAVPAREDWAAVSRRYREKLYERGERREARAGFAPEQVRQVLEAKGQLGAAELLRCRVRYFSDGVALGSRAFVESVFQAHRAYFGPKRRTGARPIRQDALGGLCTARDLRLDPITVPVPA
jgi:REP element-mobilizing transposase RayT